MFETTLRILALTRKELAAVLMDPRGRVTVLMPVVFQTLIFGYAASFDLNEIPYAVWDRDRSAASHDLLAKLEGSRIFHRVADVARPQDVKAAIDERRVLLVVQIDQDFERRLVSGRPADVQVLADGRNSNTAATALGYVNSIVAAFNADWRTTHGVSEPPITVISRAWFNPNFETRWTMIPSLIGTLTMLGTLLVTAMSVAREREQGTFDQLLVTPFRPYEIMAGKALPSLLIGTAQATFILLVAQLWFRIPFAGSFATLYTALTLFLLAAIGMGLLVSSVAATMQQAMLYSFVVMMPFTILSGLTTPIRNMPEVFQYLTRINPLRYAIEMARRIYLEGSGLAQLIPSLWPLGVIALVTLSAASWMFRHRVT